MIASLFCRVGVLSTVAMVAACSTSVPLNAPPVPPVAAATQPAVPAGLPPVPVQPSLPASPATTAPPPVTPQALPVDKQTALRTWMEQQNRIYRVAAPLLFKNVETCRERVRPLLGLTAKNKYSYGDEFVDAAASLGLEDRLRVISVLPGSGAERAGVEHGDVLLVAGIDPLPSGRDAERGALALIGAELQGRESVHLTAGRDEERITTDIPLTPACAFSLELGDADEPRSYSDGRRILVTRGMANVTHSDTQLAYVIAKEMARSLQTLEPDSGTARTIDTLHTLHAGPTAITPLTPEPTNLQNDSFEWQVLAIDLLQRAGYATQEAVAFWQGNR